MTRWVLFVVGVGATAALLVLSFPPGGEDEAARLVDPAAATTGSGPEFPPLDRLLRGTVLGPLGLGDSSQHAGAWDAEAMEPWLLTMLQLQERGEFGEPTEPGPAALPGGLSASEQLRLTWVPMVLQALEPHWRSGAWGVEETRRAQGAADLLSEHLGAPSVRFAEGREAANQRAIERLVDWFADQMEDPARRAAILQAPALVGVPVDASEGRVVAHAALPDGLRIEARVVPGPRGGDAAAVVGRRGETVLWSRLLTDEHGEAYPLFLLEPLFVEDLGDYGWRAEVIVAGVPLHVHLARDGSLLFYTHRRTWVAEERRTDEFNHLRALAQYGMVAEFDRMVEQGADPHYVAEGGDGETLLHVAAGGGHLAMVQRLVDLGLALGARTVAGATPVYTAALRAPGFDRMPVRPPTGTEHRAIVAWLLDQGVPVDLGAGSSGTPLHAACRVGCLETARLLLDRGADPSAVDFLGRTPLHEIADAYPSAETSGASGHTPDFPGLVRLLLSRGAILDPLTAVGGTPLEEAAEAGALELVDLLLREGANPTLPVRDYPGGSALYRAAAHGHLPVLRRMLREEGVDVRVRTPGGATLLHAASGGGDTETVSYLLDRGLEGGARDSRGNTPLHAAARAGHLGVVRLLLSRGADVRAVNEEGWTALHAAASGTIASETLLRLLVDRGLDVHARAKDGRTPLAVAEENDEGGFFSTHVDDRLRRVGAER